MLSGVSVSVVAGVSEKVSTPVVNTVSMVLSVKSPVKVVTLSVKLDSEVVSKFELVVTGVVELGEAEVDVVVTEVAGDVVVGFKVVDAVVVVNLVVEVVVAVLVDRFIRVLVTLAGL